MDWHTEATKAMREIWPTIVAGPDLGRRMWQEAIDHYNHGYYHIAYCMARLIAAIPPPKKGKKKRRSGDVT